MIKPDKNRKTGKNYLKNSLKNSLKILKFEKNRKITKI